MSHTQQTLPTADLNAAYAGSYFTILGAGGDLNEWVDGITTMMEEQGIGTPRNWAVTNGAAINYFAAQRSSDALDEDVEYDANLTVLTFPLDGLSGRLPLFKLEIDARWFDDVIDNMIS